MPKGTSDLPSTLRRSASAARETWRKTHDSAVASYGEGERAHRTAYAALKHSFEKVEDHWEPKARRGPSDAQAARSTPASQRGGRTAGGVDANAPKSHLLDLARRLEIRGRSRMTKGELVDAIGAANRRATAASSRGGRRS